jgi:hypothetical protein
MKNLRPEVQESLRGCGGLYDIFDDLIKTFYNITDDEYDYIADNASDDELHIFLSALGGLEKPSTFTERRKGLIMRNHYIEKYNSENKYEG